MPLSLKIRLAKLEHKGQISQEEYQSLITKLNGHDKQIRTDAFDEFISAYYEYCEIQYGILADDELEDMLKVKEKLKEKKNV